MLRQEFQLFSGYTLIGPETSSRSERQWCVRSSKRAKEKRKSVFGNRFSLFWTSTCKSRLKTVLSDVESLTGLSNNETWSDFRNISFNRRLQVSETRSDTIRLKSQSLRGVIRWNISMIFFRSHRFNHRHTARGFVCAEILGTDFRALTEHNKRCLTNCPNKVARALT